MSVLPVAALDVRIATDRPDSDLAEALRATSLSAGLLQREEPATPQDVLAAAQADYARLVGLLYDRGYFGPVISIKLDGREVASIPAVAPPRAVGTVQITVREGQQFRFGDVQLTPLAPGTELPEDFARGAQASTSTLRDAAEAGVTGWRDVGHAKAALSGQTIIARHDAGALDADLRLDPGPRLRFGDLVIRGPERMREDRIRDIAGLPTGSVFDPEELELAATRLRRTGVFSVVVLSEAEQPRGDVLDINTQLTEAKPRRFGFGAELSTQQGLGLSAFWLHRNLFGGAERLRIEGEVEGIGGDSGGEDYNVQLTFGRPATFNEDTDFYAEAEISSEDEPNYSADRIRLEAGIRRYASLQREYTFGLGFEAADTVDAFGEQSYRILTAPMGAEFDYRNNELNATDGYYARVALTPFLNISGTASGVRLFADGRVYRSFGAEDRFTFALRGQLGAVSGPSLQDAPVDFLFYSGGGGTVRGQDYQSLGVELASGATVGGRSFIGLSGEIRAKTTDNLSIVGFYDLGYVGSEEFPDGSSGEWHSGAGLGIRYDTGIGPVRLDVGLPISGPSDQSGFEIYIGIGQAF